MPCTVVHALLFFAWSRSTLALSGGPEFTSFIHITVWLNTPPKTSWTSLSEQTGFGLNRSGVTEPLVPFQLCWCNTPSLQLLYHLRRPNHCRLSARLHLHRRHCRSEMRHCLRDVSSTITATHGEPVFMSVLSFGRKGKPIRLPRRPSRRAAPLGLAPYHFTGSCSHSDTHTPFTPRGENEWPCASFSERLGLSWL